MAVLNSDPNQYSPNNPVESGTNNALKNFALTNDVKGKKSEKFGEKIVLQVENIINSSYFTERNARFTANRAMAAGRMDMNKFKDFFNIDGKQNYVNISWKAIMIVNTIVSRLVGRWMTKKEKASVTAVDPISTKYKKEQIDEAEYYLYNKDVLEQLQQQSGVQMIPDNAYVPDDKDDLDLWAKEELRTPEEIVAERGINGVFDENGWGTMGINTRKAKIDAAEVGLTCSETIADKNGKIHIIYHKPENCFYSYSERDDFEDAAIKGAIVSMTISEIRYEYPHLSMEELFEIAKESKQWQANNKITYDTNTWNGGMYLPIDDWNVDVAKFTLKSLDVDRSLFKKGRDGRMYVDKPSKRIEDVYEGNEYVEKGIWNIYRGVYVRNCKKILSWGLEKNMIRPQSYKNICQVYSPFSFYMYQNVQMRNLAIPEKIEEPVEMMILTRLKIQQLIAKMHPSGYQYDIDGLQAMDLGNGIMKPLELMKITDQTGNVYFRSRDAEGNRLDSPIRELPNSGSVSQLQQLIETYNFHQQVLRDEIGSNEYAEGQTVKPRTGVQNVQTSLEISFNAIDYMNDACIAMDNENAKKIACLLKDAIEFGSDEYRELMSETDIKDREFDVKIEMLPDIESLTEFDNSINNLMVTQPDLAMYMNPEKIKRIARDNIKLAEQYLRAAQSRAIRGKAKEAQRQSEMNAQIQAEAGKSVEIEKRKTLQEEIMVKSQLELALSQNKQKQTILDGIFSIYAKGTPMPQELAPLAQQVILNVGLPLFNQNQQTVQGMQEQAEQQQIEEKGMPQEQQMGEVQPMI